MKEQQEQERWYYYFDRRYLTDITENKWIVLGAGIIIGALVVSLCKKKQYRVSLL